MIEDEMEFGWACKAGIDQWHGVETKEYPRWGEPFSAVTLCGVELSRANGDSFDFSAHPRIGTRCDECESQRVDRWCSWLFDESTPPEPDSGAG
jgi:hypothetical protein